jgi:hypothetical protein
MSKKTIFILNLEKNSKTGMAKLIKVFLLAKMRIKGPNGLFGPRPSYPWTENIGPGP